ncbi:MAG: hypothetical protein HQL31_02045 [Planctomycetes bacterium]|nr:hypothetical protein [Planctomycetota bacterium]
MTLSLDEAQEILNSCTDEGADFCQLRLLRSEAQRNYGWEEGRITFTNEGEAETWLLRSFCGGYWGSLLLGNAQEIKARANVSVQLAKQAASMMHGPNPSANSEKLAAKAIRQRLAGNASEAELPEVKDLSLLVGRICDHLQGQIRFKYQDAKMHSYYWDSDHSRDIYSFAKASLLVQDISRQDKGAIRGIKCFHYQSLENPFDPGALEWPTEVRDWYNRVCCESFKGPSPEDLPWIFSPRAFAHLIHYTLGPTLCIERPDPFHSGMNPAELDGCELAPPCLSITSSPGIVGSSSPLDAEGVPAAHLELVQKGKIVNFVLSRQSSHVLSRSLSLSREIHLAGSSRILHQNCTVHPYLKHIEVGLGANLSAAHGESHLYIHDIGVKYLDPVKDRFVITAFDSLVSKYGGLHLRHIPRLDIVVTRDHLWSLLEGVGNAASTVNIPQDREVVFQEVPSAYRVPEAVFKGMPCTWS